MDAGKNVGRCICPVDKTYQFDKNIIPVKLQRAEKMTVRIEGGNDQEQCHSSIDKCNISEEIRAVMEEQPDIYNSDICKPQQIRNNKIFTERNVIIQWKMNHMVWFISPAFQPYKPDHINNKIGNYPYMRIFFFKCFYFCRHEETSIIKIYLFTV